MTFEAGGIRVGSIGAYIGASSIAKDQVMVDSIVVFALGTRSITCS